VKGEGLKLGPFVAEQEFLGIVEAAAKDSVIEHEERELIKSVIEFGDTTVREIMVPRPDVVHVDDHLTVRDALDLAVHEGFSRLPVMRKDDNDEDDVIGVVTVKDLIVAERSGSGGRRVDSLVREVDVVPEGKPVADVMRSMQASKFHMVMVADEYGTIIGLVTLEDCLEELVGEIVDEHDDDEEPAFSKVGPGEYVFVGSLPISEFNEHIDAGISDEEYDTIGGYVFGVLGHVPEVGESIAIDGWVLSVEVLDGRRIQQLRARAGS
jgi:putative hemolysin